MPQCQLSLITGSWWTQIAAFAGAMNTPTRRPKRHRARDTRVGDARSMLGVLLSLRTCHTPRSPSMRVVPPPLLPDPDPLESSGASRRPADVGALQGLFRLQLFSLGPRSSFSVMLPQSKPMRICSNAPLLNVLRLALPCVHWSLKPWVAGGLTPSVLLLPGFIVQANDPDLSIS